MLLQVQCLKAQPTFQRPWGSQPGHPITIPHQQGHITHCSPPQPSTRPSVRCAKNMKVLPRYMERKRGWVTSRIYVPFANWRSRLNQKLEWKPNPIPNANPKPKVVRSWLEPGLFVHSWRLAPGHSLRKRVG